MDDASGSHGRQSASFRRRGETTVPANRGKAQQPRTRLVGLEKCHLVSCERQLLLPTPKTCTAAKVLDGTRRKSPWHGRDSPSVVPDMKGSFFFTRMLSWLQTKVSGLSSELMDLGSTCSVIVASDSQSVIYHSRRRGHSVASKHVGLRGLWLQETIVEEKLALAEARTAVNPADGVYQGMGVRWYESRRGRMSRTRHVHEFTFADGRSASHRGTCE